MKKKFLIAIVLVLILLMSLFVSASSSSGSSSNSNSGSSSNSNSGSGGSGGSGGYRDCDSCGPCKTGCGCNSNKVDGTSCGSGSYCYSGRCKALDYIFPASPNSVCDSNVGDWKGFLDLCSDSFSTTITETLVEVTCTKNHCFSSNDVTTYTVGNCLTWTGHDDTWDKETDCIGTYANGCLYLSSSTSCTRPDGVKSLCGSTLAIPGNLKGQCADPDFAVAQTACLSNKGLDPQFAWVADANEVVGDGRCCGDDEGSEDSFYGYNTTGDFGVCIPGLGWKSDPDYNEDACVSVVNYMHAPGGCDIAFGNNRCWQDGVGCCGDDGTDIGNVTGGFVCTATSDGDFAWQRTQGKVYNATSIPSFWMPASGFSILYNGSLMYILDNKTTDTTNHYNLSGDFDGPQFTFNNDFADINGQIIQPYSYVVVSDGTDWYSCDVEAVSNNFGGTAMTLGGKASIALSSTSSTKEYLCYDGRNATAVDNPTLNLILSSATGDAFAACYYEDIDVSNFYDGGNILKGLTVGNYVFDGTQMQFCTGTSETSVFTSDMDSGTTNKGCNFAVMPYNEDYDTDLDRMKATGTYCCGDDYYEAQYPGIDGETNRYEYFSDTEIMSSSGTQIACWNNRPVYENNAISQLNGRDINLLRNANFMPSKSDALASFKQNWVLTGPSSFTTTPNKIELILGDEITSGQIETEYPVHLTSGSTFIFSFGHELTEYVDEINTVRELEVNITDVTNGETISKVYSLDNSLHEEELKFIAQGELYSFSFAFTGIQYEELALSNIGLTELPVAVAEDGTLFVCKNKEEVNPLPDFIDTESNAPLFDSAVEHCSVVKGEHRCDPNGYWIFENDEDNNPLSTVSVSPNIIEDSGLYFGTLFEGINGCEHIINYNEDTFRTLSKSSNDEIITSTLDLGDKYVECSLAPTSPASIDIMDSNGSYLPEGKYIFSAWFNGSGIVSIKNVDGTYSQRSFNNQDWKRINVTGSIGEHEAVEINFSGDFKIDALQLEPKHAFQFERGRYFDTTVRKSCCSGEFECWNGQECVDFSSTVGTPTGETQGTYQLNNPQFILNNRAAGYICTGGSYQFVEKKFRWNTNTNEIPEYGFCKDTSCFVGDYCASGDYFCEAAQVDRTNCVANGDSFYGYECKDGNWSSNVEYLASGLETFVQNTDEDYALYCGDYHNVLNYYDSVVLEHDFDTTNVLNKISKDLPGAESGDEKDHLRFVDKACYLSYDNGEKYIIGIALHEEPSNTDVAEQVLGAYFEKNSCSIDETENSFQTCPGSKIYYNPVKQLILFAKYGISTTSTNVDSVLQSTWIQTLISTLEPTLVNFNSILSDDVSLYKTAISKQKQYDELYIYDGTIGTNSGRIESTRQKVIDTTKGINGEYLYLYEYRIPSFIKPNDDFVTDFSIMNSPNDKERRITLQDVFNVTSGGKTVSHMVTDENDVVAISVLLDNSHYDTWYTFTGRLRGDVSLND